MPLSLEETHDYVVNTLPNAESLSFIVNGLPTKVNNIWRGLVDMDNIYKALNWLKLNNKLYNDVVIADRGGLIRDTDTLFVNNDDLENSTCSDSGELLNH